MNESERIRIVIPSLGLVAYGDDLVKATESIAEGVQLLQQHVGTIGIVRMLLKGGAAQSQPAETTEAET